MGRGAFSRVLIANRGEIAIRISAAAAELRLETLAVYAPDDARSRHVLLADRAVPLTGEGARAYLDIDQLIAVARAHGCDAVRPGYGFLSEDWRFADACGRAGLVFVGPGPETLALLGDKARARALAARVGVPVLEGTQAPVSLEEARDVFRALPQGSAMVLKAVAGGGGRGMGLVRSEDTLASNYQRCEREARLAFGDGGLIAERFMEFARHVEIQIVADAHGEIVAAGERECSLQRRNQKLVELAPAPGLAPGLRARLIAAAVQLAQSGGYVGLGTFEFLLEAGTAGEDDGAFAFIEANPRLQVEHTVTEEAFGVDLVQTQFRIAAGETLSAFGFTPQRFEAPRRAAMQMRINLEEMEASGLARPTAGPRIASYGFPSGRGVRVDGYGYAGYDTNPRYDSLIAKLIVATDTLDFEALATKALRALGEVRLTGVETNLPFLRALLARPELASGRLFTRFIDDHAAALVEAARAMPGPADAGSGAEAAPEGPVAGDERPPDGAEWITAPMQGVIASLHVGDGDVVAGGQQLATIEAMKMVHAIEAPSAGAILLARAAVGQFVRPGAPLFAFVPAAGREGGRDRAEADLDPGRIRADLAALLERRRLGTDEGRAEAAAKRRRQGGRTVRENIADLCDPGSFLEYGDLAIAAQRTRRSEDDLIRNTPADGMVAGIGTVNGERFGPERGQCAILAYDYTVLAGTQGHVNHKKKDRMLELAERRRLPVILFSEGGGGRPGDTDVLMVAGLDILSFACFAKLSGLTPLVGINSGRCFAGNAALLGCCDVIIATRSSSIGMSGPVMIEGGGLGVFHPDEIGPLSVQWANGVVDIAVRDEAEAVAVAKRYLAFFQGRLPDWTAPDQTPLRALVPEDRTRIYDIRKVITGLVDEGSLLELRAGYGLGIVTALARIAGRPIGLIANNPMHLGGAIDGPAADKASRFMQLCDAVDVPIVSLCDTPGFMVGPDTEKTAVVRRFARMFVTAAGMTVPVLSVVLRKAYGLGALSMIKGNSRQSDFVVSWPTGEFGGMGIEGAIKLGFRKEMEAIADTAARERFYREKVAEAYAFGRALNAAAQFEIDSVIDPAETRGWIETHLRTLPDPAPRAHKKRTHIDTW
ncbi:MAG: ATP-grasp domain-containing protein [Alphaproteobacteria bacterium]|nr:ATP-grasp domain-containing protein [Alphaproteobacteria bacterium]